MVTMGRHGRSTVVITRKLAEKLAEKLARKL